MGGNLLVMTKGGKLDVWHKEAVGLQAGQHNHLCELFINWEISHVLHPNSTGVVVVSRHRRLYHGEEDEFVIVFTFDNAAGKPHPHRSLWVLS